MNNGLNASNQNQQRSFFSTSSLKKESNCSEKLPQKKELLVEKRIEVWMENLQTETLKIWTQAKDIAVSS